MRKCLLLDEPMAGVEGQAYAAMQRVVREVAESGVAVCVVEHNVAFIRDLCDEGVFMFSGAILARGIGRRTDRAIRSSPNSISGPDAMLQIQQSSIARLRLADGAQRRLAVARRRRAARHLRPQRRRQDDAAALHVGAVRPRDGKVDRRLERRDAAGRRCAENVRRGHRVRAAGPQRVSRTSPSSRTCRSPGCCSIRAFVHAGLCKLFPVLDERRAQRAGSMSGGEQQMLALGMALMTQPKWLLLDEPSTGLAPVIVRNVMQRLREINERMGVGLIVVEQNVPATLKIVQRAIIIKSGHIVFDGTARNSPNKDLWQWF